MSSVYFRVERAKVKTVEYKVMGANFKVKSAKTVLPVINHSIH